MIATATALTDRKIKSLKPREKSYDVSDGEVAGLMVRVMPSGHRSFVLVARYPGSSNPTRRALGAYVEQSKIATADREPSVEELLPLDALTLAEARSKAQAWRDMIKRSLDPSIGAERRRSASPASKRSLPPTVPRLRPRSRSMSETFKCIGTPLQLFADEKSRHAYKFAEVDRFEAGRVEFAPVTIIEAKADPVREDDYGQFPHP